MTTGKLLAVAALLALLFVVTRSLLARNRDKTSAINLDELLLGDDGKPSKAAAVMYVALGVSSWAVVYLTLQDKLTDLIFTAYLGGWVAPTVSRIFKGQPGDPQPPPAGPTTTVQAGSVEIKQ